MSRYTWLDGQGTAHNAFPGSEFVRGKDAYFRPVWTESGPDGGIYIADLYRGIIQEKEWFPSEVTPELQAHYVEDYRKNKLGLWVDRYQRVKRWGMIKVHRHGRIYRLLPDGKPAGKLPHMLDETPAQLAAQLADPNGWWRDTAQMLIVSRGDKSARARAHGNDAAHRPQRAHSQPLRAARSRLIEKRNRPRRLAGQRTARAPNGRW